MAPCSSKASISVQPRCSTRLGQSVTAVSRGCARSDPASTDELVAPPIPTTWRESVLLANWGSWVVRASTDPVECSGDLLLRAHKCLTALGGFDDPRFPSMHRIGFAPPERPQAFGGTRPERVIPRRHLHGRCAMSPAQPDLLTIQ